MKNTLLITLLFIAAFASSEDNFAESDSVESDPVESESVESDPVESDPVESESVESDSSENDSTRYNCFVDGVIELANNEVIRRQTLKYNTTPNRPQDTDKNWHTLDVHSPTLKAILKNPASKHIWQYIQTYSIDGEGFLIGADGGLVAATAKTSDYYQGDEAQFEKTITLVQGEHWMEMDIVDESASAMLIKIAVPVFAQEESEISTSGHAAIGVLVVGLHQSVLEISSDCEKFESEITPTISK